MALGSAFPRGFVKSQIQRQLRPGTVIKMRQTMDDGLIHEKRFVIAAINELTVTFIINTAISPFLKARPALLKMSSRHASCRSLIYEPRLER